MYAQQYFKTMPIIEWLLFSRIIPTAESNRHLKPGFQILLIHSASLNVDSAPILNLTLRSALKWSTLAHWYPSRLTYTYISHGTSDNVCAAFPTFLNLSQRMSTQNHGITFVPHFEVHCLLSPSHLIHGNIVPVTDMASLNTLWTNSTLETRRNRKQYKCWLCCRTELGAIDSCWKASTREKQEKNYDLMSFFYFVFYLRKLKNSKHENV